MNRAKEIAQKAMLVVVFAGSAIVELTARSGRRRGLRLQVFAKR